jgi:hypothetical protein
MVLMAREMPVFPVIEFCDIYGNIHIIKEIREITTFDCDRKIIYITHEDEEVSFVTKER